MFRHQEDPQLIPWHKADAMTIAFPLATTNYLCLHLPMMAAPTMILSHQVGRVVPRVRRGPDEQATRSSWKSRLRSTPSRLASTSSGDTTERVYWETHGALIVHCIA